MTKLLFILLAATLSLGVTKNMGRKLTGSYIWQYTMTENEMMLIKQNNFTDKFNSMVQFRPNFTFTDSRLASCGNDVTYRKKGRYFLSHSKLIMNYTGGSFSDNVGGNSRQVYVLGRVHFNVTRITADTIFLTRVKGNSEKTVSLLEEK